MTALMLAMLCLMTAAMDEHPEPETAGSFLFASLLKGYQGWVRAI